MTRYLALLLVANIACNGAAFASGAEDEIRDLYRRALTGAKEAVEPCIAKLKDAVHQQPENHLARVTLGSALTLRSRDMGFGPAKLRTLKEGIALMTAAVDAAPKDAHVRLVRALTLDALPSFLGNKRIARQDFEALTEIASRNSDALTAGELQTLYYNSAASHAGDAAAYREQITLAAKYPVDPAVAAKVNARLAKLPH